MSQDTFKLNVPEFNKRYGWFTQQEGEALFDLARYATTILEIGCWEGRSTYALCEGIRYNDILFHDNSPCGSGTVFTVDHFLGVPESGHNQPGGVYANLANDRDGVISRFLQNTAEHRRLGIHYLIEAPFDNVYPHLDYLFRHTTLDLAFIDDDHSYETVKRRIHQCRMLVRSGGVICGHDYRTAGNEGVKKAVEEELPGFQVFPGTALWHWRQPS